MGQVEQAGVSVRALPAHQERGYELPSLATAVTRSFSDEARAGISQDSGVWFPEPVVDMCLRSDRYDQQLTLLHFERDHAWNDDEEVVTDAFDRFTAM